MTEIPTRNSSVPAKEEIEGMLVMAFVAGVGWRERAPTKPSYTLPLAAIEEAGRQYIANEPSILFSTAAYTPEHFLRCVEDFIKEEISGERLSELLGVNIGFVHEFTSWVNNMKAKVALAGLAVPEGPPK